MTFSPGRATFVAKTRIPTLDGLRAVAVLLVIVSHTGLFQQKLVSVGHVGVVIFFALSGFLITYRMLVEFRTTGRVSLRDFYVRRAFRILPPAMFFLMVVSVLDYSGFLRTVPSAILAALFFYSNYVPAGDLSGHVAHFWSLSVEEHFYLLWPLLLIVCGIRRGWIPAAILITLISLWRVLDNHFMILAHLFPTHDLGADFYHTDHIADVLLWGCCLAFYFRSSHEIKLGPLTSMALAAVALVLMLLFGFSDVDHFTPLFHFLPVLLIGSITSAPSSPLGRFLDTAPLRAIGELSYSLYIWHQIFLMGVGPKLPLLAAIPAIFACAYVSHRCVEQPCIALGKRLLSSMTGREGTTAAPSA